MKRSRPVMCSFFCSMGAEAQLIGRLKKHFSFENGTMVTPVLLSRISILKLYINYIKNNN